MIVDVVEGNEKAGRTLSISSVPYWPWSLVKYLLQGLPATAVSRLVGPSYKKTDASKL